MNGAIEEFERRASGNFFHRQINKIVFCAFCDISLIHNFLLSAFCTRSRARGCAIKTPSFLPSHQRWISERRKTFFFGIQSTGEMDSWRKLLLIAPATELRVRGNEVSAIVSETLRRKSHQRRKFHFSCLISSTQHGSLPLSEERRHPQVKSPEN